jgi:methylmalonyl-CoA mutase
MIINRETGWCKTENPTQGSFLVEELTDLVEEMVYQEFEKISARGGVLGAMETGYQRSKIQDESMHYEVLKHTGELPIVGVNCFLNENANLDDADSFDMEMSRCTTEEKQEMVDRLSAFNTLHADEAPAALLRLQEVARSGGNVFEELMETVKVASLGQITDALFQVGGQYRRNM